MGEGTDLPWAVQEAELKEANGWKWKERVKMRLELVPPGLFLYNRAEDGPLAAPGLLISS